MAPQGQCVHELGSEIINRSKKSRFSNSSKKKNLQPTHSIYKVGNSVESIQRIAECSRFDANVCGMKTRALIETMSPISTITVSFLKKLVNAGVNLDEQYETLSTSILDSIYVKNSSENKIEFKGLIKIPIHLVSVNRTEWVYCFIQSGERKEDVVLGANALAVFNSNKSFSKSSHKRIRKEKSGVSIYHQHQQSSKTFPM